MKDKMVNWTEQNDKIEGPNKIIDLNDHIEGEMKSKSRNSLSPTRNERLNDQRKFIRAATSP